MRREKRGLPETGVTAAAAGTAGTVVSVNTSAQEGPDQDARRVRRARRRTGASKATPTRDFAPPPGLPADDRGHRGPAGPARRRRSGRRHPARRLRREPDDARHRPRGARRSATSSPSGTTVRLQGQPDRQGMPHPLRRLSHHRRLHHARPGHLLRGRRAAAPSGPETALKSGKVLRISVTDRCDLRVHLLHARIGGDPRPDGRHAELRGDRDGGPGGHGRRRPALPADRGRAAGPARASPPSSGCWPGSGPTTWP
ncbi:MAG: hypothetical protein MZV63_58725 [Marinilabiliales bacterium]|nr:hypothetical protein [Marinilabiliales bacterium]